MLSLKGPLLQWNTNIFVACCAGNLGPAPYTVWNTAPWITTVGAGSIDRSFPAKVLLGNGMSYIVSSLYTARIGMSQSFPQLYLSTCESIDTSKQNLTGNIVVCFGLEENTYNNGVVVHEAGSVGLIQVNKKNKGEGLMAAAFPLPGALVGFKDGEAILAYIRTSNSPAARFFFYNHTVIGKDRAPILAAISSRGPNPTVPNILKPDLIAARVNILGAYVPNASPSLFPYDSRRVNFTILSGTSMACPHVAGTAALLRAAHPKSYPGAIRSALMTTAGVMDNQDHQISQYEDMEPATVLGIGAGHINPKLAADPGLIYVARPSEYISFLCSLKYTKEQIKQFVTASNPCSGPVGSPGDLNYPSFFMVFKPKDHIQELKRTLTNVGERLNASKKQATRFLSVIFSVTYYATLQYAFVP